MTDIETPPEFMDRLARDFVALTADDVAMSERCEKPDWMLADMAFAYWLESKTSAARPRKAGDGGSRIVIDGAEIDVRGARNPTQLSTLGGTRLADMLVLVGRYDPQLWAIMGWTTREEQVRQQSESLNRRGVAYIVKSTPAEALHRMKDFKFALVG